MKALTPPNPTPALDPDPSPNVEQAEERDCENKLVVLLDYDKFDLIKLLLKHRWKVAACTQLAQAQSDAHRTLTRTRALALALAQPQP